MKKQKKLTAAERVRDMASGEALLLVVRTKKLLDALNPPNEEKGDG